ncbi:hypothetical protein [Sulfurovum sp.]|uniref:hypothetical protein n=1 Tax=Sulfurovum sp. TaxID=1969726 RepID=UPI0026313A7A|nr:hypothetical protein [Sulfurovum sp.]
MNKIVTLSLIAATSIMMTGCGSSSGTNSNPTPTPAPTATPTPAPTSTPTPVPTATPDYDKKAPITQASVQRLTQNAGTLQVSNTGAAIGESVASMITAQATAAFSGFIITTWAGDLPCSVFGNTQGSGSIKASVTTATTGQGNVYTLDFQDCKFDTDFILDASSSEDTQSVYGACRKLQQLPNRLAGDDALNGDSNLTLNGTAVSDANISMADCGKGFAVASTGDKGDTEQEVKRFVSMMISVMGVSERFADKLPFDLTKTVDGLAGLNDKISMTGHISSRVFTLPVAGNIWDTEFAANNFDLSWKDNAEQVEKLSFKMNGKLTGTANSLTTVDLNVTPNQQTATAKVTGSSNMTTAFNITTAKFGGLYFDASTDAVNSAHEFDLYAHETDVDTNGAFGNTWNEEDEAHWNDKGNGRLTFTARDNSNGWEGEFTLNNKNFTQERVVLGDNTNLFPTPNDRTRLSTLNINGEFGAVFKGLPIIWNTAGLFNFNTATIASRAIYDNIGNAPVIESGLMTIGGAEGDIEIEYTANSVLMRVMGGTTTVLPVNMPFWAQMFPQP